MKCAVKPQIIGIRQISGRARIAWIGDINQLEAAVAVRCHYCISTMSYLKGVHAVGAAKQQRASGTVVFQASGSLRSPKEPLLCNAQRHRDQIVGRGRYLISENILNSARLKVKLRSSHWNDPVQLFPSKRG